MSNQVIFSFSDGQNDPVSSYGRGGVLLVDEGQNGAQTPHTQPVRMHLHSLACASCTRAFGDVLGVIK